ncbi:ergothioneine biosynthesis protein EgtB [Caldiplasma sukawensis]
MNAQSLEKLYNKVRKRTLELCSPLKIEDYVVQYLEESSPPKWHLGHTTWFFEKFILEKYFKNYRKFNEKFDLIFNSYYNSIGSQMEKVKRGTQSRPTVEEIRSYREYVDELILDSIQSFDEREMYLIELGINHEEQHQELLLMDIKANNYFSIIRDDYCEKANSICHNRKSGYLEVKEGIYEIGYGGNEFSFDNERPRHKVYSNGFRISDQEVTNGEYMEFIKAGGYKNPLLWLSEGWNFIVKNGISMPMYWKEQSGNIQTYEMSGFEDIDENAPVSHISYYEADAYARWKGKRLPTEYEWEIAFGNKERNDLENFLESKNFRAICISNNNINAFGNLWEWTSSPYIRYPGGREESGEVGEYNYKFMSGQYVLRGGSYGTPGKHFRPTYRNFYHPWDRWQFCGFRLAEDI